MAKDSPHGICTSLKKTWCMFVQMLPVMLGMLFLTSLVLSLYLVCFALLSGVVMERFDGSPAASD